MERIGRYEVVDRMGSGGFATVYRARDPHLDSEVAIKVLAENWTDNVDFKDRFMREAQLLRRIDSAHVITVHDIGELGTGQPYFVMALADRGTLEDRLEDRPPPSAEAATAIAERMADCVGTIHSHDLIHRDIKPSNLLIAASRSAGREPVAPGMLEANERLVLGDFGLAKDTALTGTGLTIAAGTGGYAAPEQMTPTGVPDQRTDLYAATAVLYRVVSGTRPPPFDLATQLVPFLDGDWWMQAALGDFFRRGMGFQQTQRHRDVQEWFDDFRRSANDSTGTGAPSPAVSPQEQLTSRFAPGGGPTDGTVQWSPPARPATPAPGPSPGISDPSRTTPDRSWAPSQPAAPQPHPTSQPQYSAPAPHHGGPPAQSYPQAPSAPQHSAPQHSAPQHSAPQHSAPQYTAPQHTAPQYTAPASGYQQVATPFSSGPAVRSSSRRSAVLLIVPVLLAAAFAGYFFLLQPNGPAIDGPDEVVAGESIVLTASPSGEDVDEFRWTNFDGQQLFGETFRVTGIVPGSLTVKVAAMVDGKEIGTTSRTIQVVASDLGPTIVGPSRIKVGEEAVFSYEEQDKLTDPRWRDPSGNELSGLEYVVTASAPGSFTITLIVTGPDGEDIGNRKKIELTE